MRPDDYEAGPMEPGTIITIDLKAMAAANLAWNGPPEDPMELAVPCPVCGGEPGWKRGYGRWRLECCGVEGDSYQFPPDRSEETEDQEREAKMEAVISWNREAAWAKDGLELDRQEAEREARMQEEDKWADENLPALA